MIVFTKFNLWTLAIVATCLWKSIVEKFYTSE